MAFTFEMKIKCLPCPAGLGIVHRSGDQFTGRIALVKLHFSEMV
jgi:hypothetical protein